MTDQNSMRPEDPGARPPADAAQDALSQTTLESLTQLLSDAQQGRTDAWDRIYGLLYRDLHRVARSQIRQWQRGLSRSPTSLISDAWLRLADAAFNAENRSHLVALITRSMRFVLLDEARRALAEKRGQSAETIALDDMHEPIHGEDGGSLEQLLALDKAMNDLAAIDARLAQVVEARYFGGLHEREIAQILGVTERTVRRDWRKARAFLFSRLEESVAGIGSGPVPDGTRAAARGS